MTYTVVDKRYHGIIDDMKEVLTKKFWRDVKKTFDEARADTTGGRGTVVVAVVA